MSKVVEEESEYYEEVVEDTEYEEEIIEEVIEEPSSSAPIATNRPVHPLFGGGGGADQLAAARARAEANAAAAPAQSSTPARPPHPLFGGGAGGLDLQNAIKKAAGERNDRVAKDGIPEPSSQSSIKSGTPSSPKKYAGSSSLGGQSQAASLADQVALLASRRNQRVGGDEAVATTPVPVQAPPVVNTQSTALKPIPKVNVVATRSNVVTSPPPAAATTTTTVRAVPPKQTIPAKEETQPVFQKAVLKPTTTTTKTTPLSDTSAQTNAGIIGQGILKPTGLREDKPPLPPPPSNDPALNDENVIITKGETTTREIVGDKTTTTTSSSTTTKTKRVTKSEPVYETTEYKVGCLCTIL